MMDIDGLRFDVFHLALANGKIPNLARLFGGPILSIDPFYDPMCSGVVTEPLLLPAGLLYPAISTAPSITYCCQASSFTGAHPCDHWIPGNVFFDRFGRISDGKPRKYEFDFLDAPQVFLKGLAGEAINPQVETIYDTANAHGYTSLVAYNMYAHGAKWWLKPGLDDWKAFVSLEKAGFGQRYDNAMVEDVLGSLRRHVYPDLLTLYFFGLDHESHVVGPSVQPEYLEVIDCQVGRFLGEYEQLGLMEDSLFAIFSDHGQSYVINDDAHALKVGFMFDREMGYLFEALDLDVQDHLLEGPDCDALISPCGGMAQVYLRRKAGQWRDAPSFEQAQQLAQAFWVANERGEHCPDLRGALSMVAVRDVENQGWYADYRVYTPGGLMSFNEFLAQNPQITTIDAENRIHYLSSPVSGDVLLFANWDQGYSFNLVPYLGTHGSLNPGDSMAVLGFAMPYASLKQVAQVQEVITGAIKDRCAFERGRTVGNVELAFVIRTLMGW